MSQAALQIDTLAFSKKLKGAGASDKLAEALAEGLAEVTAPDLVTKTDLANAVETLEGKIDKLDDKIDTSVKALDDKIGAVREDVIAVREEVIEVKSDLRWIKLIGGVIVGLLVLPLLTDLAAVILN